MPSSFSLFFSRNYLLVANLARKGPVLRYDPAGQLVDAFIEEGKPDPPSGTIELVPFDVQAGPDGWLYALTLNPREVWRFSRSTGGFAGVLVSNLQKKDDWRQAFAMAFGPDGHLYLSTDRGIAGAGSEVLRFDGQTGAPLGAFVPAGSGGLQGATCLGFGPDGHLYVAGDELAGILRFHGTTGAAMGAFVASHPHANLTTPRGLAFGPDGHLYALAGPPRQPGGATGFQDPDRIVRYHGTTGVSLGDFVSPGPQLGRPIAMAFGPDGDLYVGSTKVVAQLGSGVAYTGRILVHDGATGGFLRALDPFDAAKLAYPISMMFASVPISVREIIFRSRIPRWMWGLGLGVLIGVIAGRSLGRPAAPRGGWR